MNLVSFTSLPDDGARYNCQFTSTEGGEIWECPQDVIGAVDNEVLEAAQRFIATMPRSPIHLGGRAYCKTHAFMVTEWSLQDPEGDD